VGLCVRPQPHAAGGCELLHPVDIPRQPRAIDQNLRGWKLGEPHARTLTHRFRATASRRIAKDTKIVVHKTDSSSSWHFVPRGEAPQAKSPGNFDGCTV
jgi:hypothetical protein